MMAYLVHSGLLAFSRKQTFGFGHIMYPLLTKVVRSRCVDAGLELEVHKIAKTKKKKKKKELGKYPTVHNNNAYTCIEVHV